MLNSAVSTVPADVLAPLGAKTSVGTAMAMFGSYIYMEATFEG